MQRYSVGRTVGLFLLYPARMVSKYSPCVFSRRGFFFAALGSSPSPQKKGGISMSSKPKSTALYTSPFSKAYWLDAAAELKDTHMLVFAALMIALRLVLKQVAIPLTPS